LVNPPRLPLCCGWRGGFFRSTPLTDSDFAPILRPLPLLRLDCPVFLLPVCISAHSARTNFARPGVSPPSGLVNFPDTSPFGSSASFPGRPVCRFVFPTPKRKGHGTTLFLPPPYRKVVSSTERDHLEPFVNVFSSEGLLADRSLGAGEGVRPPVKCSPFFFFFFWLCCPCFFFLENMLSPKARTSFARGSSPPFWLVFSHYFFWSTALFGRQDSAVNAPLARADSPF